MVSPSEAGPGSQPESSAMDKLSASESIMISKLPSGVSQSAGLTTSSSKTGKGVTNNSTLFSTKQPSRIGSSVMKIISYKPGSGRTSTLISFSKPSPSETGSSVLP